MDDFDDLLAGMSRNDASALPDDFADGVWSRVGEIQERRVNSRSNMLALAMFVVAIGTGFGVAEKPALAHGRDSSLNGSADYSPATLLHVIP